MDNFKVAAMSIQRAIEEENVGHRHATALELASDGPTNKPM